MSDNDEKKLKDFKYALLLIKFIAMAVGIFVLFISRYAFTFFLTAMIPTVVAVFTDRRDNKCMSATICTFNLIGVLPYLDQLWHSPNIDATARMLISNLETWLIIYFLAFLGRVIIWFLPDLVSTIYIARAKLRSFNLELERNKMCDDWGIDPEKPLAHEREDK